MSTAATTDGPPEERALGDGLISNLLGGDAIRGIAMTMVFLAHVAVNADPGAGLENYHFFKEIVGRFDLALATFFVLSGYLIARPFLRSFVLDTKRPSVRRFTRNRVLRIVPAFFLISAIVLLIFGLDGAVGPTPDNPTGTAPPSTWWQIVSVFTFTQSYTTGSATLPIGQDWSLDVEVAFYAAIPIAAAISYRLGRRLKTPESRGLAALIFVGVLALVSIYLRQHNDNTLATLASPPLIIYAFLPGIALAIAEPWAVPIFRGNPRRAKRFAWSMLAAAVLCWALYCYWDFNVQTTAIHHALGRRSLVSALFGMALLAALIALQLGVGKIPRIIDNRWTNFMGERSYAFYLMHIAVILLVIDLIGADAGTPALIVGMLVIAFPVTVALSALSWKFYERPFLERRLPWAPGLRPEKDSAHEVADPAPDPEPQPATTPA
ncbi:MAG TPA: acyltransferase [Solirubrobacteraceae bacterium]|nr:acyltransferase [Solirubrobacteraceae bacterium]